MCVLVTQLCPTLCDPMDFSPPGSSVHGILQAKILEWVAISFSKVSFSSSSLVAKLCPTLATPQTIACHIPLSMGFSRQEYWSELPFSSPVKVVDQQYIKLVEQSSKIIYIDNMLLRIHKMKHIKYDIKNINIGRLGKWVSLIAQLVKNPPEIQETPVWFLDW